MPRDELRAALDVSPAGWTAPRLDGRFGTVTRTVPSGYPAYARICHPAPTENENEDSWATWPEVAAETGRRAHPTMQWHAVVGSPDPDNMAGSLWRGDDPEIGNLEPHVLTALCDVLAEHTTTPANCWFCLWEGYGWIHGIGQLVTVTDDGHVSTEPLPPAFTPERIDGPRVEHPDRAYYLFTGPLRAALAMGSWITPDFFDPQSPNLFWPDDRAWCVASEIDFDSTLVAGSQPLIDALLHTPGLDAWPVTADDSLAVDADRINLV